MSALAEDESEFTAALRAELEEELRNKKQCTYQSYECTQLCLEGYKFCSKHILQDKNAPFKQCSYVFSSNGKRCHLPAPKSDTKKDFGYCNEHALRATLARNKQNSKNQPPRSAEVLLHSLSHYIKKPKTHMPSTSYSDEDHLTTDEKAEQNANIYNDPFVDLDANSILNDKCNEVLDYCSESESDVEPSTLSSVWHDGHADSSDDESIDSEQEDPLKHANIYTAEEITLIIRDKLIKLQSLYVEQYRHLQYLLKEKRRKYLHALKREKETCCKCIFKENMLSLKHLQQSNIETHIDSFLVVLTTTKIDNLFNNRLLQKKVGKIKDFLNNSLDKKISTRTRHHFEM